MKFNPDLMRTILLYAEEIPAGKMHNGPLEFPDVPVGESHRHAQILIDEGYLEGIYQRDSQSFPRAFVIKDLTMEGHNFLSNARNNTVWKKVVAKATADGNSVSLTILNKMLEGAMKKVLGVE